MSWGRGREGVECFWEGLKVWDLQMTLQKVCYKAVSGSAIIHVRWCVNAVLCGLVHFSVFPPCVHKTEWRRTFLCMCVCDGSIILLCCLCLRMSVCLCMRAHVAVGLMPLSPCGNPSPTLPLPIQIMPSVGKCATRQLPRSEWALMASKGTSHAVVWAWPGPSPSPLHLTHTHTNLHIYPC